MLLFQLFMIEPIRAGLLSIEGAAEDVEEEFAVEKGEGEVTRNKVLLCQIDNDLSPLKF